MTLAFPVELEDPDVSLPTLVAPVGAVGATRAGGSGAASNATAGWAVVVGAGAALAAPEKQRKTLKTSAAK